MKILLVSLYFPPTNTMGAVRLGKLAKYLLARGHDVRVIAAQQIGLPETLPLEIPGDRVVYTPWSDINFLPKAALTLHRHLFGDEWDRDSLLKAARRVARAGGEKSHGWSWREVLYRSALNWPDQWIGWMPFALSGARRHLEDWSPEVVYASGPPHTGLLVGRSLARRYGVPWIAELRDRWTDDPYRRYPRWRNGLEKRLLERRTLGSAAAMVTVSEPWARFYSEGYGIPVHVVGNGYDPADYDSALGPAAAESGLLRIVYTGAIYVGRRDPSPLFEALACLGAERDRVRVEFFGADETHVVAHALRHGVSHLVTVHQSVPYLESVTVQRRADVLLLIQWNDPREQGNVPGKLFEYLGARRPILGLGLENGVPATIIRERSAGLFSNDPKAIANWLRTLLATKGNADQIAPLPEEVCAGFSRDEQFRKLEEILSHLSI